MENIDNYKVYKMIFPNEKSYIGITRLSIKARYKNGKGYVNQPLVYNAIKKYGQENIKHELLFDGLSQEHAEEKEIELIAFYKSNNKDFGYNTANGGFHSGKHSEETKKRIGAVHKSKKLSKQQIERLVSLRLGRKNTAEHNLNISKAKRGVKRPPLSEDWKRKIGKSLLGNKRRKGIPHTPEIRAKIGLISSRRVNQIDINSDKIINTFPSVRAASVAVGAKTHSVIAGVCGKKKYYNTAYGYKWEYALAE